MADHNVTIKRYNNSLTGDKWEKIYPKTKADLVDDSTSTNKFVTGAQKTWISDISGILTKSGTNLSVGGGLEIYPSELIFSGNSIEFDPSQIKLVGGTSLQTRSSLTLKDDELVVTKPVKYTGTATEQDHLVTKKELDNMGMGVKPAEAVRAASTGNINIANVIAGGKIDGVSLSSTNRVLLKNQTLSAENGIYTYNGSTNKLEKIVPTEITGNDNVTGSLIRVFEGTVNAQDSYYCQDYGTGNWILFDSNLEIFGSYSINVTNGNTISIKDTGVQTAHLQDGAVKGAKIALYAGGGLETGAIGPDPFNPLPGYQELKIASGGVVNDMIANGTISLLSKTVAFRSRDDYSWNTLTPAYNADTDTPGSNTNIVQHIEDLASAIKLLRGTPAYKTSNTQTISDLYATKNRTFVGVSSVLPTSENLVTGDIWYDTTGITQ